MLTEIKRAVRFTIVTMALFGGAYHAVLWGVGRVVFPAQTEGSLIRRADGTVIGSRLIAQRFARDDYFHPRPSAVDYNGASTGGSNYGPSNPEYLSSVRQRVSTMASLEGLPPDHIPAEMVTASGGGLDPDISVAGAELQAPRVARARGVSRERLGELIRPHHGAGARISRPATRECAGTEPRPRPGRALMPTRAGISIWDPAITRRAIVDSARKLDPRIQVRNPVMFIVEAGSLITTVIWIRELTSGTGEPWFSGQVTFWLWFTVTVREFCGSDGRRAREGAGRNIAEDQS